MGWQYHYTPTIWPLLATAAWFGVLTRAGWRRRAMPGATPFAAMMLIAAVWAVGNAFEAAATEMTTKTFWFLVQHALAIPGGIAAFCFALQYAGLGKWITLRFLTVLMLPEVAFILLSLTNSRHGLLWESFWVESAMRGQMGPAGRVLWIYAIILLLLSTAVFVALFIRSPLHRWPIGVILAGQLVVRITFSLQANNIMASRVNLALLGFIVVSLAYAYALFHYRFFSVVPIGRESVIERMVDGMLVVDAEDRVADLNPAAQRLLGLERKQALGRPAADILPVSAIAGQPHGEIQLTGGDAPCWCESTDTPLIDRSGFQLGRLIVLHDITERRRAEADLAAHQRALAVTEERARLARELHDGLGQTLSYVKMRAQVARDLLAQGQAEEVDACLANLAAVAQDAHTDVREFLLAVRADIAPERAFVAALRQYVRQFSESFQLRVDLDAPDALPEDSIEPTTEVQLLRIVQEALTNARKHAHASCVRVSLATRDNTIEVRVEDDGKGFDPDEVAGEGPGFGIRFMRERAEKIGGNLTLYTAPGRGTQIVVRAPFSGADGANGHGDTP